MVGEDVQKDVNLSHANRLLNIPQLLFPFKDRGHVTQEAAVWMAERIMSE